MNNTQQQCLQQSSDLQSTLSDKDKVDSSASYMPMAVSIYPETSSQPMETPLNHIKEEGDKLLYSQQYERAATIYNQALPLIYQNSCPESQYLSEELLSNMALCSFSLGDYNNCRQYAHQLLELNSQSDSGHYYIALAYEKEGQIDKCIKYINLAYSHTDYDSKFYEQVSMKWNQYHKIHNNHTLLIIYTASSLVLGAALSKGLLSNTNVTNSNGVLAQLYLSTLLFGGFALPKKQQRLICWGTLASTVTISLIYKLSRKQ